MWTYSRRSSRGHLPIGDGGRVIDPALADDVDVRIFVADGCDPVGDGVFVAVRKSVDAQAVEVGVFNPPYRPLLEILQGKGVAEVHVGHGAVEPAARIQLAVVFAGVRVGLGGDGEVGVNGELVYPIAERQVLHPPMRSAAVVRDHVHYELHSLFRVTMRPSACKGRLSELGRPDNRCWYYRSPGSLAHVTERVLQ